MDVFINYCLCLDGVEMKYKEDDILFYVNPVVFFIEKVKIKMGILEDNDNFYIDSSGAWLREGDLFTDLKEAKTNAIKRLEKFSCEMRWHILNDKLEIEEG